MLFENIFNISFRAECESQVKGYPNARYKKFCTEEEANLFINGDTSDTKDESNKRITKPFFAEISQSTSTDSTSDVIAYSESEKDTEEPTVEIYTDGACCANGKNGAKAGIGVYWGPNHPLNVSERLPGRQTNNRAEIHAAVRALSQAKENGYSNVTIYTDSHFLIKAITKWIHIWKKNGWKLSTGKPVINKEDFEELELAKKGIKKINWVHVRGHQGIFGNEQADKLAVQSLNNSL